MKFTLTKEEAKLNIQLADLCYRYVLSLADDYQRLITDIGLIKGNPGCFDSLHNLGLKANDIESLRAKLSKQVTEQNREG